jgi:DNA-binding NtrC family response regulator
MGIEDQDGTGAGAVATAVCDGQGAAATARSMFRLAERLRSEPVASEAVWGGSPCMRELLATLERLQRSLVTVLIEGESGSGKEHVARHLHARSRVADGPFVAVNCGALERALARSELFGHRRGAFTSAVDTHVGAIEAAGNGTVFLDEIADLPLDVQPTLLRAMQNRSIVRVGESVERPVRVRIVAATHRDLASEVRAGRFREDLYFRLAVVTLHVPALRERRSDIEPLAQHFAAQLGIAPLCGAVVRALEARPWPGNVRELHNVVEHYAALGTLPAPRSVSAGLEQTLETAVDVSRPYAEQKRELMECFQRTYFRKLIALTAGNQSEAARVAGIERSYFSKLIKQLSHAD